jgi:hypothetical protein
MGDWLLNLPIPWMALFIFAATYFIASCVYLAVVRLAVDDRRARAFKAFSPGMLPVLGTIFALLVASSPYRFGMTSIRPSLRSPQRPAHYEPLMSSPRPFPMSRERNFVRS